MERIIKRGDIYYAELNPVIGSEQGGTRPVLIISNDTREQHLDRGIKEITAYCEQNNLELEKIFTDQQTGKNFNRPRYQVLKEEVYKG